MPNITISLDQELLNQGRAYARRHNTSMNAVIRKLLEQTVRPQFEDWIDRCFELMDQAGGDSQGRSWTREALYDD